MKVLTHRVAGAPVTVYFPSRPADLAGFWAFLDRPRRALAVDTETTGLDIYSRSFALRLVQFGDEREAWVLRADVFASAIEEAFRRWAGPLLFHNATYDLLVLDHAGLLLLEDGYGRAFDTRILAHLIDPRLRSEGGTGHGLKELSAVFVDAEAPDTSEGLKEVFRKEYGATKETGWSVIDVDHPTYVLYAGLDVILTSRLFEVLGPVVRQRGLDNLSRFEHTLAGLLARLERRGFLLDVAYTERLRHDLHDEALRRQADAAVYGVANVNSVAQVSEALLGMGETLTEKTPSGKWKVDKGVLLPLADLDLDLKPIGARTPNPLAEAVFHAKRSEKWATAYAAAMLDLRDAGDRIHPKINSLQARTARMSISRPPLQQLPSGDWTIRRCLIADPGMTIVAADYAQVELRVLAALAKERRMIEAIESGQDLHDVTALALFGEGFTKGQRKLAKTVGFGKVYGGGAATLSRQAGVTLDTAKRAAAAYDRNFPGIKRLARSLQERAQYGEREVVTPSGRRLPLDRDRLYSATNYLVQSSARDVLAQALLDLDEAGLTDHLLLPVHDEVIAQAPAADAADLARELAKVMTMSFHGVQLDAEASVYGPSWGHGYGAPE